MSELVGRRHFAESLARVTCASVCFPLSFSAPPGRGSPPFPVQGSDIPKSCRLPFLMEPMPVLGNGGRVALRMIPAQEGLYWACYRDLGTQAWKATHPSFSGGDEALLLGLPAAGPGEVEYSIACAPDFEAREHAATISGRIRIPDLSEPGMRLAFASDSHVYRGWAIREAWGIGEDLRRLSESLEIIERFEPDLVLLGGDEFMIHCNRCPEASVDGESAGQRSAQSPREAELRYRQALRLLRPCVGRRPTYLTMGNHDGEESFSREGEQCRHSPATAEAGRSARLKYLGHPGAECCGNADGTYYSISAADTLVVVLDVMRYTPTLPRRAEDWSLGPEQWSWLRQVLRESAQRWKVVAMHHLVGGVTGASTCYHYGRGSVRATAGGMPGHPFLGEQQQLQRLFEESGVTFVLLGHDHVFAAGEVNGVWYVTGGKSAGRSPGWAQRPEFRQEYDFDLDGEPDFTLGTGVVLLELGPTGARLRYQSSEVPDPGGMTVYELTLPAPRPA